MSDGEATNGGASNGTHTPSQRYLSTRGEDNDVRTVRPLCVLDTHLPQHLGVRARLNSTDLPTLCSSPSRTSSSRVSLTMAACTSLRRSPLPRAGKTGRTSPSPSCPTRSYPYTSLPPRYHPKTSRILSTGVTRPSDTRRPRPCDTCRTTCTCLSCSTARRSPSRMLRCSSSETCSSTS